MTPLQTTIEAAAAAGKILPGSAENLVKLLGADATGLYARSIDELVTAEAWSELDDRFYRALAFGTGGLRGRSIGRIVTTAEMGTPDALGRPEFPCVGTNAMNFFNISRATQGLAAYVKEWCAATGVTVKPRIAIAHDTRHFSRDFAELAAKVAAENGCDVFLFKAARSTPELSFAVRHTYSHAGIVITASHNPPHDNGYKVYFGDGAQVVDPHDSGIIEKVNALTSEIYTPVPENERGVITPLGEEMDDAYCARLETLILRPELLKEAASLKFVYTPIHGTGGALIPRLLSKLGVQFLTVPEQDVQDGRFPTVPSPNPENASALQMGIDLAEKENADVVVATDPDCDRMGVAVRTAEGGMKLITGNQIGSLLIYYRTKTFFDLGILTPENASRGVIITTLVTSDLQNAIAAHYGLRCVDTLTGFKHNGRKLGKYEAALPAEYHAKYRELSEAETRELRLKYSSFYVCGGEESYGYSGADFVRDKDGNGATIMFAELAAYAKSRDMTIDGLLDEAYSIFGFYMEKNASLFFEGAEGAAKIQKLVASYSATPPSVVADSPVTAVKDYAKTEFFDVEGDKIPFEKMLIVQCADGSRIAVRGSGTEPKIKYYIFANKNPEPGKAFGKDELAAIKEEVALRLSRIWSWLETDANQRLES